MFYFRAWAILSQQDQEQPEDPFNNQLYAQFMFHRWGYAALLLITLVTSILLNSGFLLTFIGNKDIRKLPHWGFLCLCIRDLIVTLILIPTVLDWFVVNFGVWSAGEVYCKIVGFLDFSLATAYPSILVTMAFILYTRRYYPQHDDGFDAFDDQGFPPPPMDMHPIPSITIQSSTPLPAGSSVGSQQRSSRPPSSAGSADGYRNGRHSQGQHMKQPFYVTPNRPGSVTGSIEGRLAAGRMAGRRHYSPSVDDSFRSGGSRSLSHHQHQPNPRQYFPASSPIREVDNETLGDADDLFDAASLDYPGRDFSTPRPWDDLLDAEVKYFNWHGWLLGLACVLPLAMGIPAALMMEYVPFRRPGCHVPIFPYQNPQSPTVNDEGFNFIVSFVVLDYLLPSLILLILLCLTCYHRMADRRFKTYIKILSSLSIIFTISRSPVDIIQLKALVEAGMGFNLRDPMEIEYEIVLIWITLLPIILNPIVYFSYLSDYRQGFIKALRTICGCQQPQTGENEKPKTDLEDSKMGMGGPPEPLTIEKTEETNIL